MVALLYILFSVLLAKMFYFCIVNYVHYMSKKIFYLLIWLALGLNQSSYAQNKDNTQSTVIKAEALYKKAIYYKKKYQYDSAFVCLNTALHSIKSVNNAKLKARIYNQFAIVNYYNYDLANSEFYCVKALQLLPEDDVYRANIYSVLALIATAKADYKASFTYNLKAYEIGRKRNDTLEAYAKYHNNIGNLYRKQKNYSQAIVHYDKILQIDSIAKRFPNKYARALANKAKALLNSGQKEHTLSLLLQSLEIRKKTQNIGGITGIYIYLSDYYYQMGDMEKSKEYALKSLNIAQKANLSYILLKAYKQVIKVDSLHRGIYFNKFSKLQDSLLNKERQFKEQSARIRYESFKKDQEIHEQKIALERRKRTMIFMSIILLIVLGSGGYFYKQKNKIAQQFKELEQHKTQIEEKNNLLHHKSIIIAHLQKEIHHRLKNNFGKIDGYIEDVIEKNDENPELIAQLETLKSRVANISAIHLQLYQSDDVTRFLLKPHVDTLFELNKSLFANNEVVLNNKISDQLLLDVNTSFILSMIINEFITNSFKYAFDKDTIGNISVDCYAKEKEYVLIISDNGKGLPENFDFSKDIGYGLEMIQLWAKELSGKVTIISNKNGINIKVVFPVEEKV